MERRGNSDEITRRYFDSILLETRYMDADLPSTKRMLWGWEIQTPIMTAALSHLHDICEDAMAQYAIGARDAGTIHWYGMGSDEELEHIIATGAKTIKIIKPHADDAEVFRRIEHAKKAGVFAVGMDIDHSFSGHGTYDHVLGFDMKPKSTEQLAAFIQAAAPLPFIVKGVLSVADAVKVKKAGAAGIVLSHHHNMMEYSVPPLMALPAIREAVGPDFPIIVDCGIVSGMDAYKALALGADGVSVGRELMKPLKNGGQAVADRIREMTAELASVMARTGVKDLSSFDPTVLHFWNT